MTRVTNLMQHNLGLHFTREIQSRIQDAQIQIGTGKKAQRYEGLAADASRLINLKSDHAAKTRFLANNTLAAQRLATMEDKVATAFQIASDFRVLLVNALNGNNAADLSLASQSQANLDQVAGLLNTRLDGRYLFAGTRTETAPVDMNAAGFATPPSVYPTTADTGYFLGDSTKLTVRADDTFTISYGVTADEAEFEQLVRALRIGATTTTSPTIDRTRLEEALRVVDQAIAGLPNIRSRIGAARATLDTVDQRHADFLLYAEEAIGDIENIDPTEAITRLGSDQVQIQASYMLLSRLGQISLTQYLR